MHVYVHVPFCARRCSYCDFAIAVRRVVPSDVYVAAVLGEWALWQRDPVWAESPDIQTLYFGGGTPSRLPAAAIGRLLDGFRADRRIVSGAEITLEANPDDVTVESAGVWQSAGVNRVSLGVQSFDPEVLRWMHRTHTADQVPQAIEFLHRGGITNLSLDLIFGLPAPVVRDWESDLDHAFALAPQHLSLYGLTLEPHTPVARWLARGEITPVDDEAYAIEFLSAHQALTAHGYEHYEVSNAARPGHRARHNSAYWRRDHFIGLGPAAHSGFAGERRWNVREWAAYRRTIEAGKPAVEGRELLDESAVALEELYLGLRTSEGLPIARVSPVLRQEWRRAGWAAESDRRVRLTPEGWLRLDSLVAAIKP